MRSGGTAGDGSGCTTIRRLAILASLLSALVAASPAAAAVPDLRASGPQVAPVIVRAVDVRGARALVERLGGAVTRPLPIVGGFAARVPETRLRRLARSPVVRSVSRDARVSLAGEGDGAGAEAASPLAEIAAQIGVDQLWAHGLTGAGVDVALVDSGVVPVEGLGQVLHGPDLSFESQNPELAHLDTFGHGTHLAGIIAGQDPGGTGFRGIAPGARIVSVKVADAFGATDVSQVIAAIDWVVQHRQSDGLNIRVLNLAFGTDSGQAYRSDPLAYAVEVAWSKGIVVVVSAGNSGGGGLTDPAYDPFVVAVGAADTTRAGAGGAGRAGGRDREPPGARVVHRRGLPGGTSGAPVLERVRERRHGGL
jgi:serine protease AprX